MSSILTLQAGALSRFLILFSVSVTPPAMARDRPAWCSVLSHRLHRFVVHEIYCSVIPRGKAASGLNEQSQYTVGGDLLQHDAGHGLQSGVLPLGCPEVALLHRNHR